jgi:hypothetical protein
MEIGGFDRPPRAIAADGVQDGSAGAGNHNFRLYMWGVVWGRWCGSLARDALPEGTVGFAPTRPSCSVESQGWIG